MSTVVDKILLELCLDDRIVDGIFRIEEDNHMSIFREFLVKHDINEADAVHLSNKILEGKFPERQAYNKDGLLVTFPTPKHKQNAINRGTHFDANPLNKTQIASKPTQPKQEQPQAPAQASQQPAEPPPSSSEKEPTSAAPRQSAAPPKEDAPEEAPSKGSDLFSNKNVVYQNGIPLKVAPPRGTESPDKPYPKEEPIQVQKTPVQIAAEKQIAKDIINTDDTDVVFPAISEECKNELKSLIGYANESKYYTAKDFLLKITQ